MQDSAAQEMIGPLCHNVKHMDYKHIHSGVFSIIFNIENMSSYLNRLCNYTSKYILKEMSLSPPPPKKNMVSELDISLSI